MKKVLFVVLFLLFSWFVFADWTVNTWIWVNILVGFQKIVQILYLLFWPLLFLASKLVSNAWVYGGSFWIDVILWKMWQTVRVFANYIIWFIFLVSIFVYFFKSESNLSWKKIFPKIVIAAIVVNLSWFIIAVLIDLSSILILAFWWLATQIKWVIDKYEKKQWKSFTMIPLVIDTDSSSWFLYVKINWQKYVPCIFQVLTWWKIDHKPANPPCFTFNWWNFKIYKNKNSNWELANKELIHIKSSSVWVFVSIFRYLSTILFISNTTSSTNIALLYFVKLILFFVLLIPFILLVILLFVRLIMLWLFIPFSPILFSMQILWLLPWEWKKKFNDILGLIFQPAYVMLMMGIGFIFLESIYAMIPKDEKWLDLKQANNVFHVKSIDEKKEKKVIINNSLVLIQDKSSNWKEKNMLSDILQYFYWFIANMLWAFVLWSLVFVAFKSNKFTEKIATAVDTYVKKTVETYPILPVAWWQSVMSLAKTWEQIQRYPEQKAAQDTSKLVNSFKDKKS